MAANVGMPKFGLSMEEGTIVRWLVAEGGAVRRGDPIAEINSEKLTNNATAPMDGVLAKIVLAEGESAPCGELIAVIAAADEALDAPPAAAPEAGAAAPQGAIAVSEGALTPRAKRLAEELGVDLSKLVGTGQDGAVTIDDIKRAQRNAQDQTAPQAAEPQAASCAITPRAKKYAEANALSYGHIRGTGLLGMITIEDVKREGVPAGSAMADKPVSASGAEARIAADVQAALHAAQAAPAAPATEARDGERIAMTPIQRATAAAMMKSLQQTAQTTVMREASVAALAALYKARKPLYAAAGVKLSYTALIVKALAMVLEGRPDIRMQYCDEKHFYLDPHISIGVAVDIPKGLIVPVIRDANLKDVRAIAVELAELSARARAGKLTEGDMGGACISVSNLGMAGVTAFTPILNPPESGILGVCAMVDKPVAHDGGIFVEPVMNLCYTYDHRVVNGAPAGRLLQELFASLNDFRWM